MIYCIDCNKPATTYMNPYSIRYGFKNFKNHMNIGQQITLRGIMRRYGRQYPRTFNALKKGFILGGVYTVLMYFSPGCDLPLQRWIKLSTLQLTHFFFRLCYYNSLSPSQGDYLIKINELILLGMDNQIYSAEFLQNGLNEVKEVVGESKKALKSSNYLDLLLYSQIQLQNIIRYSNRALLLPVIYNHYLWIYETTLKQLSNYKVTKTQEKHIKMFYVIMLYLLNFSQPQLIKNILTQYYQLLNNIDPKTMTLNGPEFKHWVAKRAYQESNFLNNMKKIHNQTNLQQNKNTILSIFNILDKLHQSLTNS